MELWKLREAVNEGRYKTDEIKFPLLHRSKGNSSEEVRESRKAWARENRRLEDLFRYELLDGCLEELKRINANRFEARHATKIVKLAWENGHSAGFEEVIFYVETYLDLFK